MDEFELIDRIFHRPEDRPPWVEVGIGDDGAVLQPSPGKQIIVVMDTLVNGTHFLNSQPADSVGHRALAVNLSDVVAMGANPRWATLSLTLPELDRGWVDAFAAGFFQLADEHHVSLIGGDTTAGPLTVSVTVGGEVEPGRVLRRGGARPGDLIFLTGRIGGAATALSSTQAYSNPVLQEALLYPQPPVALGQALGSLAHSAIDLSDGLLADLGHVLKASGDRGAQIEADQVPLFEASVALLGSARALELALGGGDDYELCFTASKDRYREIDAIGSQFEREIFCIGRVTEEGGCRVNGRQVNLKELSPGYQHTWQV